MGCLPIFDSSYKRLREQELRCQRAINATRSCTFIGESIRTTKFKGVLFHGAREAVQPRGTARDTRGRAAARAIHGATCTTASAPIAIHDTVLR